MRRATVALALVVLLLAPFAAPAGASTPTPTAEPSQMLLPTGWGPDPGLRIIEVHTGGFVDYIYDAQLPCADALYMAPNHQAQTPARITMRVEQTGDNPSQYEHAIVRFGFWSTNGWWNPDVTYPAGVGFDSFCFSVESYSANGVELIDSDQVCWCNSATDPTCDMVSPFDIGYGYPWTQGHGYFYNEWMLVEEFGQIKFHVPASNPCTDLDTCYPPGGLTISGLWIEIDPTTLPAPVCSAYSYPTPSPYPTSTPTPSATPTITGTTYITPTATNTPLPTAQGPTATPTLTPRPFSTWTATVTPTPWQTPAATVYLTPTPRGALPTWPAWPTVDFPTFPEIETVTPFYTYTPNPVTTTPLPTPTWVTYNVQPGTLITQALALNTAVNYQQVYSAGYQLAGSITYPIRVVRNTVRVYMPGLALAVDGLIVMLFVIAAVLGFKVILAAVGAVIKIVEVIMEFIPL